jgi:hypothetical protein
MKETLSPIVSLTTRDSPTGCCGDSYPWVMLNMVDPTLIDAINFINQYLARSSIPSD